MYTVVHKMQLKTAKKKGRMLLFGGKGQIRFSPLNISTCSKQT